MLSTVLQVLKRRSSNRCVQQIKGDGALSACQQCRTPGGAVNFCHVFADLLPAGDSRFFGCTGTLNCRVLSKFSRLWMRFYNLATFLHESPSNTMEGTMIDRSVAAADNKELSSSSQAFGAAQAVERLFMEDELCGMRVLVIDLDAIGLDECISRLRESHEPCRFVVWHPRDLSRVELVRRRGLLVENGAILLTKSHPEEGAWACWQQHKTQMEKRRRQTIVALSA
jgi:hypothetical protein